MTVSAIMRRIMVILIAIIILSPYSSIEARKIKTRHTLPKETEKNYVKLMKGAHRVTLNTDSVDFCDSVKPAVRFYGFDKTAGSSLESFFISNGLDSAIEGMDINITYFDMKGRMLHRREARIDCNIPTGETIRTDINSWDTQKSFYFHKSVKPKRQATPFDVKIELLSIDLNR